MGNARKCNRCGKCFDPLTMEGYSIQFPVPTVQTAEQIKKHECDHLFEIMANPIDLCPECSVAFKKFMGLEIDYAGKVELVTRDSMRLISDNMKLMEDNRKLMKDNEKLMKDNERLLNRRKIDQVQKCFDCPVQEKADKYDEVMSDMTHVFRLVRDEYIAEDASSQK